MVIAAARTRRAQHQASWRRHPRWCHIRGRPAPAAVAVPTKPGRCHRPAGPRRGLASTTPLTAESSGRLGRPVASIAQPPERQPISGSQRVADLAGRLVVRPLRLPGQQRHAHDLQAAHGRPARTARRRDVRRARGAAASARAARRRRPVRRPGPAPRPGCRSRAAPSWSSAAPAPRPRPGTPPPRPRRPRAGTGSAIRQRLAWSRSAKPPPGETTTSTTSSPSGIASSSRACTAAGSTTSAIASSRYSASLAAPVGDAPA